MLLSLHAKHLVHIDMGATEVTSLPGEPARFGTVTAELTDAGRQTIENMVNRFR
jgi:hypothetical protein